MYEVTCPHCGHVMESPFVREGAMALCRQCSQTFKVTSNRYRKLESVNQQDFAFEAAAEGREGSSVIVLESAGGPATAEVIGLTHSGAFDAPDIDESLDHSPTPAVDEADESDVFEVADDRPRVEDVAATGLNQAAPLSGRRRAVELNRRRNRITLLWLLLGIMATLSVLGAVLAVGVNRSESLRRLIRGEPAPASPVSAAPSNLAPTSPIMSR